MEYASNRHRERDVMDYELGFWLVASYAAGITWWHLHCKFYHPPF